MINSHATLFGLASLGIAIVYAVVWPGWKEGKGESTGPDRPLASYIILRWFHSLAWILIALSLFVRASSLSAGTRSPNILALSGLAVYVVYIAAFLRGRHRKRGRPTSLTG